MGFSQSTTDHSLFLQFKGSAMMAILVYVDDVIVASSDSNAIQPFISSLDKCFHLKDLGPLRYFLGVEVARSSKGIFISQRKYILDILQDTGLSGCKPQNTPMESNLKLSKHDGDLLEDPTSYRRLIGRLIYLSFTRPDLSFAVNRLSQFLSTPRVPHLHAAHRILAYLKHTIGQGIFFATDSTLHLKVFSDSDWASCPDTRRSVSGFCVFLVILLSPGSPRNNPQSQGLRLKQNTALCNSLCWFLLSAAILLSR
ncbi:uncharacterized mitochondrial protein AtMg00810-like [Gastrolobium bilobum]|uniref:uncharacterized mitochondrial protein AtMg00810-like n=1 Tax=Gastrolobium bilobum TaxID=150636 RepID=UPI002AB0B9F8|nr:uncharacterized mitochondrial protein AtMg00810-like [Gastrolobium bilobum]